MRRAFAAVLVSIALVVVGALPAQAWDATKYDRYNKDKPAFNLKRAYFGYWPEDAIVRVKVENRNYSGPSRRGSSESWSEEREASPVRTATSPADRCVFHGRSVVLAGS